MRNDEEQPPEQNHYICDKSKVEMSVFFVCTLGNELSKMKPETPVSFAEMQDAVIALAKSDDLSDDKKLFYTMESYLSKSGLPDQRDMFTEAFKIATEQTKEAYPNAKATRKVKKLDEV